MFSIPGQNLSLPDISYLYSLMDFRQFLQNKSGTPSFQLSSQVNGNISFQSCLYSVARKMHSSMDNYYDQFYLNSKKLSQILPCGTQENFPQCKDYCKWHENTFNKNLNLEEFLTTMRYSLPQRKILFNTFLDKEKKIASKLFGNKGLLDSKLNQISAPSVLTIFCHNKFEGFTGDDIGISDKVCDEFFPTPTDSGICMTSNLDIKKIAHVRREYEPIFEQNKQTSNKKIQGGAFWSESTLIINTADSNPLNHNYPRSPNADLGEIQFQLHQSKEFAHFLDIGKKKKKNYMPSKT